LKAIQLLHRSRRARPALVGTAGLDQHDARNDRETRVILDVESEDPIAELKAGRFRNRGRTMGFDPAVRWSPFRIAALRRCPLGVRPGGASPGECGPGFSVSAQGQQLMARLRVLHVIQNLNYGGMERLFADLVRLLDPERFESHVMYVNYLGRFGEGLER
jgi:hypothetical protein